MLQNSHANAASVRRRPGGRALAALLMLAGSSGAIHAQSYQPDNRFNAGAYYVDAFAGSFSDSYRAKKLVRLDTGEVIVAGLVPHLQGGNAGGLGLVRYNARGQRVVWANPGSNGYAGNQYVVYDVNSLVPRPIDDVKDLRVLGNLLLVLVDSQAYRLQLSGNPPLPVPAFAGYAADVLVFTLDGQYLGGGEAGSAAADNGAARNFSGGGIVAYDNSLPVQNAPMSLVFGGTAIESGVARPVLQRFDLANDGSLSNPGGLVHPNPGNYCPADRSCEINGLALGGRPSPGSAPRIYAGGARQATIGGSDWDFMAMNLSASGIGNPAFNGSGVNTLGFHIAGGSRADHGRAIAVVAGGSDQIYVAGDVAVNCGDGMGVVKFAADGTVDTSFGPGNLGKLYFGANYSPSFCVLPRTDNITHALAVLDGRLALVGQRDTGRLLGSGSNEDTVDALLAVVDGTSGDLLSFADYPYRDTPDGPRSRHSGLWGVVADDRGAFTASGDVRYREDAATALAGRMQFATLRFSEHIFISGFGTDAER